MLKRLLNLGFSMEFYCPIILSKAMDFSQIDCPPSCCSSGTHHRRYPRQALIFVALSGDGAHIAGVS